MPTDNQHLAPCPTCEGERYDVTYRGAPAEDGGPDPCPTCNGSGTTEPRIEFVDVNDPDRGLFAFLKGLPDVH